jgi:hypothetical protein
MPTAFVFDDMILKGPSGSASLQVDASRVAILLAMLASRRSRALERLNWAEQTAAELKALRSIARLAPSKKT